MEEIFEWAYFCRHKFTGIDQEAKNLAKNGLFGYHFSDEFHEKYEDYKKVENEYKLGFKKAFKAFEWIEKNGSLIVIEYESPSWFIIAEVPKGQKTQPYDFIYRGENLIYKTLRYINPKKFSYADYPVLAALRPPYSTICCPQDNYQIIVKAIYYNQIINPEVKFLHPQMLEQLCEHYLRSELVDKKIRLAYTITKSGKTLHVVDIVGRSINNKKILAQVTFANGTVAKEKIDNLIDFKSSDSITIMFSSDTIKDKRVDFHYNIADVFQQLKESTNPIYKKMIYDLVGLNKIIR